MSDEVLKSIVAVTQLQKSVEKKTKEQIAEESRAEKARRKAAKAIRSRRRQERRLALKGLGFRANRKMTADKKTGKPLPGHFQDGTSRWVPAEVTA